MQGYHYSMYFMNVVLSKNVSSVFILRVDTQNMILCTPITLECFLKSAVPFSALPACLVTHFLHCQGTCCTLPTLPFHFFTLPCQCFFLFSLLQTCFVISFIHAYSTRRLNIQLLFHGTLNVCALYRLFITV